MSENILIVEDDVALRKQIRFSLEKKNNIFEAQDKKSALEILKDNAIMAVILDLGLPPTPNTPDEGLNLIDIILNNYPAKVVVLTGQDTEPTVLDSIRRGVFDFIGKPVSMNKLLFSVERALIYGVAEKKIEASGIKKVSFNIQVGDGLQNLRDEAEKNLIFKILKENDFNVYKTAKILGIKRENLYYFIKKFGWEREKDV